MVQQCDYFAPRKAGIRSTESTNSLQGKQQSATRKASVRNWKALAQFHAKSCSRFEITVTLLIFGSAFFVLCGSNFEGAVALSPKKIKDRVARKGCPVNAFTV